MPNIAQALTNSAVRTWPKDLGVANDGILISRAVAEKSKAKAERINALGVHRMLRVPREFPIMGDCGAFDYIMEDVPPYST